MGLLDTIYALSNSLQRNTKNTLSDLTSDPVGLLGRRLSQLSESLPEYPQSVMPGMSGGGLLGRPSPMEWGTGMAFNSPTMVLGITAFDAAQKTAQRNAAKPISSGGLGLPKNNTAMDRAKALGYTTQGFRGTTAIEESGGGSRMGTGTWWTQFPELANVYARDGVYFKDPALQAKHLASTHPNVMPLLVKVGDAKQFEKYGIGGVPDEFAFSKSAGPFDTGHHNLVDGKFWEALTKPENVRSRFAAFDPAKTNSRDLLAALMAASVAAPLIMGRQDE